MLYMTTKTELARDAPAREEGGVGGGVVYSISMLFKSDTMLMLSISFGVPIARL